MNSTHLMVMVVMVMMVCMVVLMVVSMVLVVSLLIERKGIAQSLATSQRRLAKSLPVS